MSYDVVEAGIVQLAAALARGEVTSAELVDAYLARIAAYDHAGPHLNSVVVLDPNARAEAEESDRRRTRGEPLGPLDGIPYTAKDSYSATGLTVAGGSPAFAHLVAQRDSYAVGRLRGAGAILLGLTNMPPMANGGMQRGLYGRAESPYNPAYLTAPFASGSSNGSGTATAASLAAFGLGEETWSSGRGPASNNGLCAYTPSRGVISIRGNWPLVPTDLLWALVEDARAAGAEVVLTDFPIVSNYEADRPGAATIRTRGLVSPVYLEREVQDLAAWSWDDFLHANGDPGLHRLADIDGAQIFPPPPGALKDRYHDFGDDIALFPGYARAHPLVPLREHTWVAEGIAGLDRTRELDLDAWLDSERLDAVIFPAVADVGPADADVDRLRRSRLAQRRLGRQRQSRAAPFRPPDRHHRDGRDARHQHAGRPHVRRPPLRRHRAAVICRGH